MYAEQNLNKMKREEELKRQHRTGEISSNKDAIWAGNQDARKI